MRFLNEDALLGNAAQGLEEARRHALAILAHAVDRVEPAMLVARSVQRDGLALRLRGDPFVPGPGSDEDALLDLDGVAAVRCVAAGKAAEGMLRGLSRALPLDDAFAVVPEPRGVRAVEARGPLPWPVLRASHPLPDEASVRAGERALAMARACGERDLLVVLLSGGASALLEQPVVPLEDLRAVERDLLAAGADIRDLNAVRAKLSAVKGGRLAAACRGRVLALLLSDVPEDHARLVGGGPCAPDAATGGDALAVLRARKVEPPASVRRALEQAKPLRPGSPELARATHVVVGSSFLAAHEATQRAVELGYQAFRIREPLAGTAQRAGWRLARMAEDVVSGKAGLPQPACIVTGGETTVDARGAPGEGGRNQELALSFLEQLTVEATLATMGTDGIDGPTDAAGAVVDMGSKERAQERGLDARDALRTHDSHAFLRDLGDVLRTGPTGTNVADIAVLLVR